MIFISKIVIFLLKLFLSVIKISVIMVYILVLWCTLLIFFKINLIQALFTRFKQYFYDLSIIRNMIFVSQIMKQNNSDAQLRIEKETCCICLNSITWKVASTCGHMFCGISDN